MADPAVSDTIRFIWLACRIQSLLNYALAAAPTFDMRCLKSWSRGESCLVRRLSAYRRKLLEFAFGVCGFCRFCRCRVAGKSQYSLGIVLGKSRDETVPIFVPTPRIEALRAVASALGETARKSLKTSDLAQLLAIVGNVAKSLKVRGFLVRDQEVGGSNPLAPTIYPCVAGG
jgi:hypothetical protein